MSASSDSAVATSHASFSPSRRAARLPLRQVELDRDRRHGNTVTLPFDTMEKADLKVGLYLGFNVTLG